MLKKSLLSSGGIFVMLVLALASLGVAYGLWSETLHVEGTIDTGEVDIQLSREGVEIMVTVEDANGVFTDWTVDDLVAANKPVPNCTQTLSTVAIANNDEGDGPNQLDIVITGLYPGAKCWFTFDIQNIGTIPVHLFRIDGSGNPIDAQLGTPRASAERSVRAARRRFAVSG